MRLVSASLFSLTTLAALAALSTDAAAEVKTIGIDGGLAMPTGDWADAAGFGFGALARFEMPLQDKLTLTARAGYIHHLAKEAEEGDGDSSMSELPLFGGVRYAFSGDAAKQFYGGAELGFVMTRVSVEFDGESSSDSDTNLGMTVGAGYRTGKLDLRANLLFPDVGELGDAMGLMATVGYDLTTL